MTTFASLKEQTRRWAIAVSGGCDVQESADGKLWPCGTCFTYGIAALGANANGQHNNPPDRTNEVWRAILEIRDTQEPQHPLTPNGE